VTEAEAVEELAEGLRRSGLRTGATVLVHSSLSSLGRVPEGAETAVRGLLEALGEGGTLLMPALSYRHVNMAAPVFDVAQTPSNVGAIPEHFRTRQGTGRSIHPTHSVCGVGRFSGEMLAEHELDETPCGANSPYRKLRDVGGQILFLGCGLRPNTSMHGVEEMVEPPYLFGGTVQYRALLPDGRETTGRTRTHGFSGWTQRYDRIADLLAADEIARGRVMSAETAVLEAAAVWRKGVVALEANPFALVEPRG